ncbi:MAG: hypothetical protein R8P61_19820 [Bacteroidia bacterium]|nr:hypothetical protein [Bacteroidia bacterium]
MEEKDLHNILEEMEQPKLDVNAHQNEFRLPLLNTKRSSLAGIILLILPFIFLSGVIFNHYLEIHIPIIGHIYEWITDVDRQFGDNSALNWSIRLLLLFGPLIAGAINLMAITHIRWEKLEKELIISFKMRWQNVLIIGICFFIFSIFFTYLTFSNLAHTS